jgi:hypothetical protein
MNIFPNLLSKNPEGSLFVQRLDIGYDLFVGNLDSLVPRLDIVGCFIPYRAYQRIAGLGQRNETKVRGYALQSMRGPEHRFMVVFCNGGAQFPIGLILEKLLDEPFQQSGIVHEPVQGGFISSAGGL